MKQNYCASELIETIEDCFIVTDSSKWMMNRWLYSNLSLESSVSKKVKTYIFIEANTSLMIRQCLYIYLFMTILLLAVTRIIIPVGGLKHVTTYYCVIRQEKARFLCCFILLQTRTHYIITTFLQFGSTTLTFRFSNILYAKYALYRNINYVNTFCKANIFSLYEKDVRFAKKG